MTPQAMYILAPQGVVPEVLKERAPLVAVFAAGEDDADAAGAVVLDALLERATWSHPRANQEAWAQREKTGQSLFWIGLGARRGMIRQAVFRRSGRWGWREIDETASVHRAARRRRAMHRAGDKPGGAT